MLYSACKQYLLAKLKGTGLKSNPYTTQKALTKSLESHVGAVLFYSETYSRNGSKKTIYRPGGSETQTEEGLRPHPVLYCDHRRLHR